MQSISNPYKAKPYHLDKDTAPAFWLVATLWRPMATGVQTANRLTLIHQQFPIGSGPVTHLHPYDECFYIMEGEYTYNANGLSIKAGPGDAVFIPRQVQHSFSVDKLPATALNFYTPSGFELLLMSVASPAKERRLPTMDEAPIPPPEQVYILGKLFGQEAVHGMPFVDGPGPDTHQTSAGENLFAPYISSSEQLPVYLFWRSEWELLNGNQQTGGSYALFRRMIQKGGKEPLHRHDQDEAVYVLSGNLVLNLDGKEQAAHEGSFIYIPAGTVHRLSANGQKCVLLNLYLPGYFEEAITKFGRVGSERESKEPIDGKALETYLALIGTTFIG